MSDQKILGDYPWSGDNEMITPVVPVAPGMGILSGGSGTAGGLTLYTSPIHFTAVFYSSTALDLSGHPAISSMAQFVEVEAWDASGDYIGRYTPRTNRFAWDPVNNRVSATGAAFVVGGTYKVSVLAADRFSSLQGDFTKFSDVSPYQLRSDDSGIQLITAAQNFTGSWVDLGPAIPMFGYNACKLWLTVDKNDGTDMRVRVLDMHESGGVEEYPPGLEDVTTSVINVDDSYWEITNDADQLITLVYSGDGVTPFIQPQISAGTPGASPAQVDAAYYTRGWR